MNPPKMGAQYWGEGRCTFTLWAPTKRSVAVRLLDSGGEGRTVLLTRGEDEWGDRGYWQATLDEVEPGARYVFQIDGEDYPDPASQSQPEGVHGPSAVVDHTVVDHTFDEQAGGSCRPGEGRWDGLPLDQYVIYELHVGTFTPEGTFEAAIARLPELKVLGITAIEIMPIAQFPGERNWGYDGTFPFAAQTSYGGIVGLKKLVDSCHQQGMAIILDVVYNHLGFNGNYLWHLGTYFTDNYKTPWGSAVNYDGAHADGVREYVIQNAIYWLETCQIDALRLDAVHAIYDFSACHILREMRDRVARLPGYPRYLIAESDLNDPRIVESIERSGYGFHSQWNDDFHHALHTVLTGENRGYYADFGRLSQLAKAYEKAFVYTGDYSPHRQRRHGAMPTHCEAQQFVVSIQNHDQVGNRMRGDRLSHRLDFEAQKLAAAAMLLSPFIPMLFMGEEYGETAPFLYFVSGLDAAQLEGVRSGRQREFEAFQVEGEAPDLRVPDSQVPDFQAPDPQSIETFERSKLNWSLKNAGRHQQLWRFYQQLLRLRREDPALRYLEHRNTEARVHEQALTLRRWHHEHEVLACLNFSDRPTEIHLSLHPGTWHLVLDSAELTWGGPGQVVPGQVVPEYIPRDRGQTITQQTLNLAPHSVLIYSTTHDRSP